MIARLKRTPGPLIFFFSFAVAILLLWREDALNQVGPVLRSANASQIVIGFVLYLLGLALLCLRWHEVVRMIRGFSNLPRASEAFLTSVVINYATPVSLAIPSRAALTKHLLGLTALETGAAAFWEVMIDLIVLAIFSLIWALTGGWQPESVDVDTKTVGQVLAAVVVLASVAIGLTIWAISRKPELAAKIKRTIHTSLTYPAKDPVAFAKVVGITVVFWIMQFVIIWILLDAVSGTRPSFSLALGLGTVPILVGMLSPVPGGAGVREALMIGIARLYDADPAQVTVVAITYRLALFAAIPVLYLLVKLWRHGKSDLDSDRLANQTGE